MPNAKYMSMDNMFIKGEVKGPPKSGKTSFLMTWPEPFFFVFDDGEKTLLGENINYQTYHDNDPEKPVAYVQAERDLEDAVKSARANNGKIIYNEDPKIDKFWTHKVDEIKYPFKHIQTICIDCADPLQDAAMRYGQVSKGRSIDVPSDTDWYPQMYNFKKFVDRALGLPAHVWLVTYEQIKEIRSRGGGRTSPDISLGTRILPAFTGKLATTYEGRFDIIVRTVVDRAKKPTQFKLQAAYHGLTEAGHRFHEAFELWIYPATYKEIKRHLDEYKSKKEELMKRFADNEEGEV